MDTVRGSGSGQIKPWTLTSGKALILGATGLLGGIQAGKELRGKQALPGRQSAQCSTYLATCLSGGESSCVLLQEKPYLWLLWKPLPRLLVILNKQNGLYTKKELSMAFSWNFGNGDNLFLEWNRRWWPLWLGWMSNYCGATNKNISRGSRQKANVAGPLTTSGPEAVLLTDFFLTLQHLECSEQNQERKAVTRQFLFFKKETRATKQKQPKI